MTAMLRPVFIDRDPFESRDAGKNWYHRGEWPAKWVLPPAGCEVPFVCAFRLPFDSPGATARIHVTADERFVLFLDGEIVARGPERGDKDRWRFASFDLDLPAGKHVIVAKVWALGDKAPYAQFSVKPGFLLAAEGEWQDRLSTGVAAWEAKPVAGAGFLAPPEDAWGTGWKLDLDGSRYPWGVERGEGDGWTKAEAGHPGVNGRTKNEYAPLHRPVPGGLPPMLNIERSVGTVKLVAAVPSEDTRPVPVRQADSIAAEVSGWQRLVAGQGPVTIPANTRRRVLIDLENYYCAYPVVMTSGGKGSTVRVRWDEALYEGAAKPKEWVRHRAKGNRGDIEGKYFVGVGDIFRLDGGKAREFTTLWWEAGRFVEILVETATDPVTIDRFAIRETRYPVEWEGSFTCSDDRLNAILPLAVRVTQMCSHETYMDCPYYEQLMYVGDTRLEVLTTFALSKDDRLPRKALRAFDESRVTEGLTQSRYPSRVRQLIPPFSLWWVAMVHDFACWRGDKPEVQRLLPGVRAVLDAFRGYRNADGLVEAPNGWNFMDWVVKWPDGCPPGADTGVSGAINWQFALVLGQAAELEQWAGDPELAARNERDAEAAATKTSKAFWDDGRGLFAEDLARTKFAEHSQCLAILGGRLDAEKQKRVADGLLKAADLDRTTIYFTHYLFEALRVIGRPDVIFDRLKLWFELPGLGFKTMLEHPEPSRSDCHAWAAHPLFHCFATILGIRPAKIGGTEFVIDPKLGPLTHAKGVLPHPAGNFEVEFKKVAAGLETRIVVPKGITVSLAGKHLAGPLPSGPSSVTIPSK